jgi:acyl carrier protein
LDNSLLIEKKVIDFVQTHALVKNIIITNQTLLLREGILDSMAFIQLVDFIEDNFDVKVADKDLVEVNFESIDAITCYISGKKYHLNP